MNIEELFNAGVVPIQVTYASLGQTEPFVFYLRPLMSSEAKAYRQLYFGLSDAEQEEKKREFNARLLALLSVKPPEGLPGFEVGDNLADSIFNYFDSDNLMRQKLADDALNLWIASTQPKEFFRLV